MLTQSFSKIQRQALTVFMLVLMSISVLFTASPHAFAADEPSPSASASESSSDSKSSDSSSDSGDSSSDSANFSLYKLGSNVGAYFDKVHSPESDDKARETFMTRGSDGQNDKGWIGVAGSASDAGAFLGYVDKDLSGDTSWLNIDLSGSSGSKAYSAYETMNNESGGKYQGLVDYVHFGATLQGLGLDSTGTSLGGNIGLRTLPGLLILILFSLTVSVEWIAHIAVVLLQQLNPFRLLTGAFQNYADSMGGSAPAPLRGVAQFISDTFRAIESLSWAIVIPAFIVIAIVSVLLFNKRKGVFRNLVVRIAALMFLIPLLGSTYTASLNAMSEVTDTSSSASSAAVLSLYVDTEGWVRNNRLAVPDGAIIEWDNKDNGPSGASIQAGRQNALLINDLVTNSDGTKRYGKDLQRYTVGDGDFVTGFSSVPTSASDISSFKSINSLILRYSFNSNIDSATFESDIKGSLSQTKSKTDNKAVSEAINNWFSEYSDADSLGDRALKEDNAKTPGGWVGDNALISQPADTGLAGNTTGDITKFSTNPGAGADISPSQSVVNENGSQTRANLTVLSTYNFLNTRFNDTSLTNYSSEKAMSGMTRETHRAVNQVGGHGVMGIMNYINTVAILASLSLIGIVFFFGMAYGIIRRSITLIATTPVMALGGIKATVKMIVITLAMIIELFGTFLLYVVSQQIVMAIPQLIQQPIAQLLTQGG